ncbi:hypothetical protein LTR86_004056 [Recurvomyces mirabilis]|nr:hypothetical protein LTR86_004056 [Recurvomyces mirabilis]
MILIRSSQSNNSVELAQTAINSTAPLAPLNGTTVTAAAGTTNPMNNMLGVLGLVIAVLGVGVAIYYGHLQLKKHRSSPTVRGGLPVPLQNS